MLQLFRAVRKFCGTKRLYTYFRSALSSISLTTERVPPLSNSLHAIYFLPLFCSTYIVSILFIYASIFRIIYACVLVNCLCSYFINCKLIKRTVRRDLNFTTPVSQSLRLSYIHADKKGNSTPEILGICIFSLKLPASRQLE